METKYKVILHILLYLLTFFAYLKALEWAIEHGRARVPTSDAMGQGMKDALNTLVYTVLAIAVVYVVSMLIAKFLLKGSILLSACINGGLILLWIAIFVFASRNQKVRPISDYLIVEINTPCLYPITVCDCKITLPNGDAYRLGRKVDKLIAVEGDAWGKGGGEKIYILSDSLPSHIDISYLSYVEDKVYHVEEDLPVEKINKLYHERWLNGWNEEQRYDGLVIGCAPYGSVQIWLRSDIHGGRRTEVCSFKGKEESEALWGYKMDCDGFYYKYDKEKVRNEVWENLKANGLPDTLLITAISGIITVSWLKRNRWMISCMIWNWFSVTENMIILPKNKFPIAIIRCRSALNIFDWNGRTDIKVPAWILSQMRFSIFSVHHSVVIVRNRAIS